MAKDVSIRQEKSRLRIVNRIIVLFFAVLATSVLFSIFSFGIIQAAFSLKPSFGLGNFDFSLKNLFLNPLYLGDVYSQWLELFVKSFRLMDIRIVLFLPLLIPLAAGAVFLKILAAEDFSFSLWYILNRHFARFNDVKNMGLFKGVFMAFGKFSGRILGLPLAESVLCLGETGSGKTAGVAIPSILKSDNASIIAVDMMGFLAKYTSGHRAKLGKVFYYNWDLEDDPQKGVFYPRWNPLSPMFLPQNVKDREAYLKRLFSCLVPDDGESQSDYFSILAQSFLAGLADFMISKVLQASANDYFLSKLIEKKYIGKDERETLLSYYVQMPKSYVAKVLQILFSEEELTEDSYFPIGSWAGIPEEWTGKEVCFALLTDWIEANCKGSDTLDDAFLSGWLVSLIREAVLFGYGKSIVFNLMSILDLSSRQRQIVFSIVQESLQIFMSQPARERTNGNSLSLENIRGFGNPQTGSWSPTTVYCVVNSNPSKILTQMFLDEVVNYHSGQENHGGPLPIIMVLDDVWAKLRLGEFKKIFQFGENKRISTVALCSSLDRFEMTYGREMLETLVCHTPVKIVKAADAEGLARQLDKMSVFATRSVQIPKVEKGKRPGKRKYFADSNYFHRLAVYFRLKKNVKINTADQQIVLLEGYYNRPILADAICFATDDCFKELAALDAVYTVEKDTKYVLTPKAKTDKDSEQDYFLKEKNEKSDTLEEEQIKSGNSRDDWWLEEDAFGYSRKTKENPFGVKK